MASGSSKEDGKNDKKKKSETQALTSSQAGLLRESWRRLPKAGQSSVAVRVFSRVYESEPIARRLFTFAPPSDGHLGHSAPFHTHAAAFLQTFGSVVDDAHRLADRAAPMLQGLGARHAQLVPEGFAPALWTSLASSFAETLAESLPHGRRRRDTLRAWMLLLTYVVEQMTVGFDEHQRALKKRSGSAQSDGSRSPSGRRLSSAPSSRMRNHDDPPIVKGRSSTVAGRLSADYGYLLSYNSATNLDRMSPSIKAKLKPSMSLVG